MYNVVIIGGGPAGLMACYCAMKSNNNVYLIDKNERLGRKILITGKGRCNITNDCGPEEFLKHIPTNPKFLYSAIYGFSTQDTKKFFEQNGVEIKTERGNRVFPVSDRAKDVADAMTKPILNGKVNIINDEVIEIITKENSVVSVKLKSSREINANSIIIATGGMSYPLTGSNGSGYKLAKKLGHNIKQVKPSLIPIISKDKHCLDLQGLSLKNVAVSLLEKGNKKVLFNEIGEMLFTHYGMSGPLILSSSAHIKKFQKDQFVISIDLKPGLSYQELDKRVIRDFNKFSNRDLINGLTDLLPQKMIPVIVNRSNISPVIKTHQITKQQRENIVKTMKEFTVSVDGFRPIEEAIITSGGIDTKEINPKTMESKLIDGLFFAGEVIDVDGYTGGFNLQIAFSTGFLAGKFASSKT